MDLFGFGARREKSKNVAKERLKLVLVSDRLTNNQAVLDNLKRDIVEVISKYMEINESGFDVQILPSEDGELLGPVLSANIPIKDMKKRS
jgi:cell division topological specificity factor